MLPRFHTANVLLAAIKAMCLSMGLDVHDPKWEMSLDHAMREVEFVFVIPVTDKSIREANIDGDK